MHWNICLSSTCCIILWYCCSLVHIIFTSFNILHNRLSGFITSLFHLTIIHRPGTYSDAVRDFYRMRPDKPQKWTSKTGVQGITGTVGRHRVTVRDWSKSGEPTISIGSPRPNGRTFERKFRYTGPQQWSRFVDNAVFATACELSLNLVQNLLPCFVSLCMETLCYTLIEITNFMFSIIIFFLVNYYFSPIQDWANRLTLNLIAW